MKKKIPWDPKLSKVDNNYNAIMFEYFLPSTKGKAWTSSSVLRGTQVISEFAHWMWAFGAYTIIIQVTR